MRSAVWQEKHRASNGHEEGSGKVQSSTRVARISMFLPSPFPELMMFILIIPGIIMALGVGQGLSNGQNSSGKFFECKLLKVRGFGEL